MFKTTHCSGNLDVLFLVGYSLLLKNIAITIIKANAMIVTKIKEKNNMYNVVTKYDSTIRLTSLLEATTSAFTHFLLIYYTINFY